MSYRLLLVVLFMACFRHGILLDGYTSVSFDNGNFNVSWMYSTARNELQFEVNVRTEGWVGFGFTSTPENMSNYDVVIGGQTRSGRSYFNDFFTVGLTTPVLDLKQSYIVDRAVEHDGITSLRFHRPRDTNDLQDIQFNRTTQVYLVWAYHLVDDASDPYDFSMHSKMGHTSESYRLVYETTPTHDTTSGQDSQAFMPSSPEPTKPPTTARQKSFGFHLSFSFLTIVLAAAFSTVIYVHQ